MLIIALGILIAGLITWRIVFVARQTPFPPQYWAFQIINGLVLGGVMRSSLWATRWFMESYL